MRKEGHSRAAATGGARANLTAGADRASTNQRVAAREPHASQRTGRPVRTLRLSVTAACNFRCAYCRPDGRSCPSGRARSLPAATLLDLALLLTGLGVRHVRLTGGEPLLRRDLEDLTRGLAEAELEVTLTTNGSLLAERAESLAEAGLGRVNVSLDTLRQERFWRLTGRASLQRVLEGIQAALDAGLTPIHMNTVAARGFNSDELADLAEFAWERGLVPRFIELMPMADNPWAKHHFLPADEILRILEDRFGPSSTDGTQRGHGPARYVRFARGGTVGLIPSVTGHFCSTCDRLRLRADGALQTCLARPPELNLLEAVRRLGPERALEEVARLAAGKTDARHWAEAGPMVCTGG